MFWMILDFHFLVKITTHSSISRFQSICFVKNITNLIFPQIVFKTTTSNPQPSPPVNNQIQEFKKLTKSPKNNYSTIIKVPFLTFRDPLNGAKPARLSRTFWWLRLQVRDGEIPKLVICMSVILPIFPFPSSLLP